MYLKGERKMNGDFLKIKEEIRRFCDSKPAEGFEIEYLEEAEKILQLYSEANALIEEIENSTLIKDLYEKLKSLLEENP